MTATTDEFATAAQALAQAVAAAAANPADGIRMLLPLARWQPTPLPGFGPLWFNSVQAQAVLAATCRWAAIAALAQTSAAYQPASYEDAYSLRAIVCAVIDDEATRAADAGQDDAYQALVDLRANVAVDLAVRGAQLAHLVEVSTRTALPSLVDAWGLYFDTTREPQLVASADPVHPAFMPLEFPALDR